LHPDAREIAEVVVVPHRSIPEETSG
jgi:hypothetical protein